MIDHQLSPLISQLRDFPSKSALLTSPLYQQHRSEIERVLNAIEICQRPGVSPKLTSFIRVLDWNIERGKEYRGIIDYLKSDPQVSLADVILLQEVDQGMARSDNKDIAQEISSALGMHYVFATHYLELSKGKERLEGEIAGEDLSSLYGVAILSRYPITKAWAFPIHHCEGTHIFKLEPRLGNARALVAQLDVRGKPLTVVNIHFSVFTTPHCRLLQAKSLTDGLKNIEGPILIAGDFNTTTLRRGSRLQEAYEGAKFFFTPLFRYLEKITHPEREEPLFPWMSKAGFIYKGANLNGKITAFTKLKGLADLKWMPDFITRVIISRLEKLGFRAPMNLDWFFLKGISPLHKGERTDPPSLDPVALTPDLMKEKVLSDHAPLLIDLPI